MEEVSAVIIDKFWLENESHVERRVENEVRCIGNGGKDMVVTRNSQDALVMVIMMA